MLAPFGLNRELTQEEKDVVLAAVTLKQVGKTVEEGVEIEVDSPIAGRSRGDESSQTEITP